MLGTRTQGGRIEGTDESTKLWRHLHQFSCDGKIKQVGGYIGTYGARAQFQWLWEETHVLKIMGLNPCTVYWMEIFHMNLLKKLLIEVCLKNTEIKNTIDKYTI